MDNSRILNSFFQTNSLNALTEEISETLARPIIITDSSFHIVSSHSSFEYTDSTYKKAIMHSELSIEACEKITEYAKKSESNRFQMESDKIKLCVGILSNAGVFMGYILYFLNETDKNFCSINDLNLCESLIAKQLYLERHCSDSAESTSEEILENLLEDKYTSEGLFYTQAAGTYLAHYAPKHLALIDFYEYPDIENVFHRLQTILTDYYHASHPFFHRNKIVMFLHEDHDFRFFHDVSKEFKVNIVISDKLKNLYDIKNHYGIMTEIADYLKNKNQKAYLALEHNYATLIKLQNLQKYPTLINPEINALLNYDITNDSELCLTLYTYLTCSHSLKKTSEIMYTHSNTVFYRIQKARDEFNVRTDDSKLHFSYLFSLALSLLKLGHEELFIFKDETSD